VMTWQDGWTGTLSCAPAEAGGAVDKDLGGRQPDDEVVEAPLRRIEGARRCPECGVRLSLYNPGPNCWQHTIGWPWRGPSAKPRF